MSENDLTTSKKVKQKLHIWYSTFVSYVDAIETFNEDKKKIVYKGKKISNTSRLMGGISC